MNAVPFNGDEAIVGLMARHILLQSERPAFFYGQAYMGSLDAYLVTAAFAIFGIQIWVIRLVQVLLYLGTLATTVWVCQYFFGSWEAGMIAAALLAIPPVNMTLYTTASLGGYGEALLIGNLILLSGMAWIRQIQTGHDKQKIVRTGIFGVCCGLGLWANGLTLVYSIPIVVIAGINIVRQKKISGSSLASVMVAGLGFLLGSLPWWLFAFNQGFSSLITELLGNNVAVETGTWLSRVGQHLLNLILLGGTVTLGFRPPWEIRWLGLPLIPFILIFWLLVFFLFLKQSRNSMTKIPFWVCFGVLITFAVGFVFTSFGVDPSGRYFLPAFLVFCVAAGAGLAFSNLSIKLKIAAIAVVLTFQAWGTIDCVLRNPPGLTTQFYAPTVYDHSAYPQLIKFLEQKGETRGYSTYWVSYPLAFRSQEDLVFSPALPYHPDLRYSRRDDRYAPYSILVEESEHVAYITVRNSGLNEYLRTNFSRLNVHWQEQTIGDFEVFFALSRTVRPQEIGLGGIQP
ncbi:MAG TPA: hypothetical protein VN452_04200 [Longilinea sp.]|nr:hypothetical protein [Longilinea sp.]